METFVAIIKQRVLQYVCKHTEGKNVTISGKGRPAVKAFTLQRNGLVNVICRVLKCYQKKNHLFN